MEQNLTKYRAFVTAVTVGSLSEAARILNYSQSGVSRMISDLERDYEEIENWIAEGRVDFGFLRLPTRKSFETIELEQDQQMVILPPSHPLASRERVPVRALSEFPFIMLEKGVKAEITDIFVKNGLVPKPKYTTFDDYAAMSMVEKGLGISILPSLILRRHSYHIAVRPLNVPAFRTIGVAMKNRKALSLAASRFLDFLDYRDGERKE